jgi:hypothetical protein
MRISGNRTPHNRARPCVGTAAGAIGRPPPGTPAKPPGEGTRSAGDGGGTRTATGPFPRRDTPATGGKPAAPATAPGSAVPPPSGPGRDGIPSVPFPFGSLRPGVLVRFFLTPFSSRGSRPPVFARRPARRRGIPGPAARRNDGARFRATGRGVPGEDTRPVTPPHGGGHPA